MNPTTASFAASKSLSGWEAGILTLIWLNVLAIILGSVPEIDQRYGGWLHAFEVFSVAVFTAEYAVRLWRGRSRYALSALGIIDLLAILPFFLPGVGLDLRILRLARALRGLRLLRAAKLGRYSVALQTVGRVVVSRRGELVGATVILVVLLLVASTLMYYAENAAQPEAFPSIPGALWWAVATLTTVGYGDVTPITTAGKLVGGLVAVLGIGMFALPAGILGSAFLEEYQRPAERCPHCGR